MNIVAKTLTYYLSEHPNVVNFRWSHAESWGSTWSFLFYSISFYLSSCIILHLFISFLVAARRIFLILKSSSEDENPPPHISISIPLGPIPAMHSLLMSLISITIFTGILLSTASEIRDTRWFWRRSKTPFQWLLCFPLGTRPSGRVFFWSYMYYLSRFLHMFRTFFTILRRRRIVYFQLLNNSIMTFMSFLWLEFSQSFQVLAILCATLVYSVVYGYRFWTAIGLRSACFPFVVNCQFVSLCCNLVFHGGVLFLHFVKAGGCNGIGAWLFNSVLNSAILLLFLNFYVKIHLPSWRKKFEASTREIAKLT